jgi:hypothetical protein
MHWVEIEQPQGAAVPLWQRSGAIAEDGTVFIPAAITGSEKDVVARANTASITVVTYLEHSFVPAEWMGKEFSALKKMCDLMDAKVKDLYQETIANNH